jgi:hypothetical protein
MPPRQARVLVDTNAIKAAHDVGCWNALRKYFRLETAAYCAEEATRLDRKGRRLVERTLEELRGDLVCHEVNDTDRAALALRLQGQVDLDDGERDVLSIALKLGEPVWWLCGPDKATLRAMHLLNLLDQACSLETLARSAGLRPRELGQEHTEAWLSKKRTQLILGMEII